MINIDNISFSYATKKVLENFSLNILSTEKICIFGESGCGKTTLLRLILNLEKLDSGHIIKPSDFKPSVVFQENLLLPFKTVTENIMLMGAKREKALYHLKALEILETSDQLPSSLSGGMQRRVAIARALSCDFNALILDEPFTGLDQDNIKKAASHILDTVKDKPIIMVSHSLFEANLLSAKIVNM